MCDSWTARNAHWDAMTNPERQAFVAGIMHAYRDIFDAISATTTRAALFEIVRERFDVELERATVAGVL